MRDICIGPRAQAITMTALLGASAALFTRTLPDIRRYLKIRSM
jgi:hypothetical protein